MTVSYLEYELSHGYIVNWLAAGPQVIPVEETMEPTADETVREQIAARYYEKKSQITAPPVERGPLNEGVFSIGAYQGEWNYTASLEDRLVDHSLEVSGCNFARSWAYTELVSAAQQDITLIVSAYGPVDIWLNKNNLYHLQQLSPRLASFEIPAKLRKGANRLLVRFANVAAGACPLALALRVQPEDSGVTVRIPTLIPALERRNQLEKSFARIALKREVYGRNQNVELLWPEDMEEMVACDIRLQTPGGRIYGQTEDAGKPGDRKVMATPVSLPEGQYQIFMLPRAWEFYESHIRITRYLDLWIMGRSGFSSTPYGTPEERRREALQSAQAHEGSLFAEIAKMALGRWDSIEHKTMEAACAQVQRQADGSELLLMGLLGAQARYGTHEKFSAWQAQIHDCALHYPYESETDSCGPRGETISDQEIVRLTCAILAGQQYPAEIFPRSGQTGQQMHAAAGLRALQWIQGRGIHGFAAWDSKPAYASTLAALSHLIDLAEMEELWELASVLMDQILFRLALNAFDGVASAPQGFASTAAVKSGLLEETAGITRLLWGMGIFNHHTAGTVSMAVMENYTFPEMIAQIGANRPAEGQWSRARHNQPGVTMNTAVYRTADYLLASTQDYQPGQPGNRQHLWQATLGPQAVVFTNHPGNASQNDAHAPNLWLGNGHLPRIAQWKNTLVAVYNPPESAWMQFTHAFFPTAEFDDTRIEGDTIFGRKGQGYIALTAANGLALITEGRTAYREVRSDGRQNIWLCRMGQADTDGEFSEFIARIAALRPTFQGLDVRVETLRGETFSFGWEQPLRIDGVDQPLDNFPTLENAYTSTQNDSPVMEIRNADYLLRLNFASQDES